MNRCTNISSSFSPAPSASSRKPSRRRPHHSKRARLDCRFLPPEAEAVAVLGDRIVAVGTNSQVDAWAAPNSRGRREGKAPAAGLQRRPRALHRWRSATRQRRTQRRHQHPGICRRIAERAAKTAKGEWVQGGDWDETKWSPAELPTKELIDPATPKPRSQSIATTDTWFWPTRSP